jgi:hypothetical protein
MTSSLQDQRFSSRRRFLQRTLGGVAGWALWHGWPSRHRALAQQGEPARADDVGDAHHPGADVV